MDAIELIRKEIERRRDQHFEESGIFNAGMFCEDQELLNFIDELEKQLKDGTDTKNQGRD